MDETKINRYTTRKSLREQQTAKKVGETGLDATALFEGGEDLVPAPAVLGREGSLDPSRDVHGRPWVQPDADTE